MTIIVHCTAIIPLLWAAVSDVKKRTIPAAPLILLAVLGASKVILFWPNETVSAIVGFFVIGVPMLLLAIFLDKGNGIGGGDVKLCALLGFLLGLESALLIIVGALLMMVIIAVIARKKELPFAPFVLINYSGVFILNLFYGG